MGSEMSTTLLDSNHYELDPEIKPPEHGPYEIICDEETEKEIEVCLRKICGKKNIHKTPGPPPNAKIKSKIHLHYVLRWPSNPSK